MNIADQLRASIREVGTAVRRPEQLATRWQAGDSNAPSPWVFAVLLTTAAVGTAAYGVTMQMHRGVEGMLDGAFYTPLAAGLAWVISFPALFIIKRVLGSELRFTTTAIAASTTVAFGATAMLASVPVNWFFTLALPWTWARVAVNVVVFGGVGICMVDVFLRVMRALEPGETQLFSCIWLGLIATIGMELYSIFGVFQF